MRAVLLIVLAAPAVAFAGGFEHPDNGTVPLGRGGAFTARASDGTAFQYNIAGLAGQRGNNLMLLSNFTDLAYCFTRAGDYPSGSGVPEGTTYADAGPMCDDHPIYEGIGPMLGFTTDLGNRRGPVFGIGIYGPSSLSRTGYTQNGEDVPNRALVTITDDRGNEYTAFAPNRFDLVDDHLDVIYFTPAAVAHEIIPGLRVGLAFQWVFSRFDFTNYGALSTADPDGPAARNHLIATDVFTPAFMLGVQYQIGKNFQVGVGFRWSGALDAEGDLDLDGTEIDRDEEICDADGSCEDNPTFGQEVVTASDTIAAKLNVGQAAQLRIGARFFVPRGRPPAASAAPERPWDPLVDEIFDVEFNYEFEANSAITFLSVSSEEPIQLVDENGDPFLNTDPIGTLDLPHRYRDNHSFRIGGDWNFLPGRAAGRLGVSYETPSSPPEFTLLDFAPFARLGVHFGGTVRLGPVDVSLAYAHIFQPPRTVKNGGGRVAGPGGLCDPEALTGDAAVQCVTNNGEYDANYDIVSIGTMWHF